LTKLFVEFFLIFSFIKPKKAQTAASFPLTTLLFCRFDGYFVAERSLYPGI